MLQQTQVKTVISYWERWIAALPRIKTLANATEEKVLKLWEGLGYYSRVRNLQKAARLLVENNRATFPSDYNGIRDLPGIGPYTAGAICSIAFNQPTPILDGNVTRVLSRLFDIRQNVRSKSIQTRLWKISRSLVETSEVSSITERPCSSLNQGLMELGATICLPQNPKCDLCPLRSHCKAFARGNPETLPNLGPRAKSTPRAFLGFIIHNDGKFLARKRPHGTVNSGLWEFPNLEIFSKKERENLLTQFLGAEATPSLRLKHTITRYRITLDVFHVPSANRVLPATLLESTEWKTLHQLQKLPFSSAHARIRAHLCSDLFNKSPNGK